MYGEIEIGVRLYTNILNYHIVTEEGCVSDEFPEVQNDSSAAILTVYNVCCFLWQACRRS